MGTNTKIEWCDRTWNPITGCTKISIGCENCYAERMAKRLAGRFGYPKDDPFRVTLHPDRLEEPLRWKKPRKIFVCSMSDLFHPSVPFGFIGKVFATTIAADQHMFLFLTKRIERVEQFLLWFYECTKLNICSFRHFLFGVTVEDQEAANTRIPVLLRIPAVTRFVSCEPLLGPVELRRVTALVGTMGKGTLGIVDALAPGGIDWVIAGCESGPRRRPAKIEWFRAIRDQCTEAAIPFFLKQMEQGGRVIHMPLLDGRRWVQVPEIGRSAGMPKRLSRHSQQIAM